MISNPEGVRIAHCVTGIATHNRYSIIYPDNAKKLRLWVDTLGAKVSDLYLHIDLSIWIDRAIRNESVSICDNQSSKHISKAIMNPVLTILSPVSYMTANNGCHCDTSDNCGCSLTYARWFQQVQKWHACLGQITTYERKINRKYDFIGKLRADFRAPVPIDAAFDVFSEMYHVSAKYMNRVFVGAWTNGYCYGRLDHYWFARRRTSEVIVNVLYAPCRWQKCLFQRYSAHIAALSCMRNERLLVEWILDHNGTVSPLTSDTGLPTITANHQWHKVGHRQNPCHDDNTHFSSSRYYPNRLSIKVG